MRREPTGSRLLQDPDVRRFLAAAAFFLVAVGVLGVLVLVGLFH